MSNEIAKDDTKHTLTYVRVCRSELRDEVNDDHFTLIPSAPEVTQAKVGFWKKLWNEYL